LIYLFEKIFNLISSVTLVELTNINSELMIKFSELAPGTFQHSMQVSNLATEAAKKINANSLLVRTGALYHDIGKIKHPEYFIENQMGGKNPLTEIDYEEASKIVINHVTDGIEIAKKYHLPEQIINFITTHHGFGKTKYFYNSFINANPGVKPNDKVFSYPGPLPNNKETAILMMADAVEARSRSLTEYTEKSIDQMVEDMIDGQIAEGEFKDAPITFRDVELVKSVFKEKIKNIYHNRIKYPDVKK
jgi:cyclic-di-AMP phosphodiesterase PgpH